MHVAGVAWRSEYNSTVGCACAPYLYCKALLACTRPSRYRIRDSQPHTVYSREPDVGWAKAVPCPTGFTNDVDHHLRFYGRSPSANVIDPRNEGREHLQPAFEVAHLAAGGKAINLWKGRLDDMV